MKYTFCDNKVIITGVSDFYPRHTFDCGQCFRWNEEADGSYTGVAFGKVVNVSCLEDKIIIDNAGEEDFLKTWQKYFDFERDYEAIKKLYVNDSFLNEAIKFGWGIHILNQDIFECLISFIISTQNQIPRIKKIVDELSRLYGDEILYNGKKYYAFPDAKKLKAVKACDLVPLKAGYRADYIVDAVSKVASGEIDLEKVKSMPYKDAKAELMKIRGVGPKVADCVLLFSAGKSEAFPVDVWVKRTMSQRYLKREAKEKEILLYANENFGKYAGFAQQYMFYYSRESDK